jgi:hypothetical protein
MWDGQSCQALDVDPHPSVPGQERMDVMAGGNVKGGDYRRVGRTALSAGKGKQSHVYFQSKNEYNIQRLVDKARTPRKGGKWTQCRLQDGRIYDILL